MWYKSKKLAAILLLCAVSIIGGHSLKYPFFPICSADKLMRSPFDLFNVAFSYVVGRKGVEAHWLISQNIENFVQLKNRFPDCCRFGGGPGLVGYTVGGPLNAVQYEVWMRFDQEPFYFRINRCGYVELKARQV